MKTSWGLIVVGGVAFSSVAAAQPQSGTNPSSGAQVALPTPSASPRQPAAQVTVPPCDVSPSLVGDEAFRPAAIERAQQLRDQNEPVRALQCVREAIQRGQVFTPSLRLFVADTHYVLGQLRETLTHARLCVSETLRSAPTLPYRERILRECRRYVREIPEQGGSVIVRVPNAPAGTQIVVGEALSAEQALRGYPVLPGEVQVDVFAPNHVPQRQPVQAATGRDVSVEVRLTRVSTGGDNPGCGPVADGGTSPPCPPCPLAVQRGPGPWPWVLLGAGVAIAGGGVALWLLYNAEDRTASEMHCPNRVCENDISLSNGRASLDQSLMYRDLAMLAFGMGGASVVSGLLWYVLSPSGTQATSHPRASVSLMPTSGGALFGARGVF